MAWWLMPRTPDPEVGGSSPTRVKPCCVLEQGIFTPQKVLVILRKRWLRPNMTEKLFTWTFRINQPTNQPVRENLYEMKLPIRGTDNNVSCTWFRTLVVYHVTKSHKMTSVVKMVDMNAAYFKVIFNANVSTKRVSKKRNDIM